MKFGQRSEILNIRPGVLKFSDRLISQLEMSLLGKLLRFGIFCCLDCLY